jgi:hypothetical protein
VISINVLLMQGSTPIGGLLLGALGQFAGVPFSILLFGVLCMLGVGLAIVYQRRVGDQTKQAA